MSLNKEAASYMPKWASMTSAATKTTPAVAPPAAAATPAGGMSAGAAAFIPRSARTLSAVPPAAPSAAAPAPQQQQPPQQPPQQQQRPQQQLGAAVPAPVQGAWAKRPSVPATSTAPPPISPGTAGRPAAPPAAAAKPVTPGSKPVTPGGRPAAPGEKYRAPEKPLSEAMLGAKNAVLKKEAVAFVPKKFAPPPPMTMVTPPVTPPAAPADPSAVADPNALMPLNRKWGLFFVDRSAQGTAAFDPTLVYEIKSVEDFWRTFNNVPSLTSGNLGSTYYFFRDNIKPKWEDTANKEGGSWTVRLFSSRELTSEAIDEIWERLLCRAIGESWPASLQGTLNGMVAKMRDRCYTIEFWVNRRVDDMPKEVMGTIGDLFKAFNMSYTSHEAARVAAAEREEQEKAKAALEKKKGKKKRTF